MTHTVYSDSLGQYTLHKGVKIYRTPVAGLTRHKCSLCGEQSNSRGNITRHIDRKHQDFITDKPSDGMEGGKKKMMLTTPEAIAINEERERRVAEIEARMIREQEALRNKEQQKKILEENENMMDEDVDVPSPIQVLKLDDDRVDTIPSPSENVEIKRVDTIPSPTTPEYSMKFEKPTATKTKKEPEYSMKFDSLEDSDFTPETLDDMQTYVEEGEKIKSIVKEEVKPKKKQQQKKAKKSPIEDYFYSEAEVKQMIDAIERVEVAKTKKELQKVEKDCEKKVEKLAKDYEKKKGVITKAEYNKLSKDLNALKKEFKDGIKKTMENLKSGIVEYDDEDMNEIVESANHFANKMIDFAKLVDNQKAHEKIDEIMGKKKGTTRKQKKKAKGGKSHSKNANKSHKRKTKMQKPTKK